MADDLVIPQWHMTFSLHRDEKLLGLIGDFFNSISIFVITRSLVISLLSHPWHLSSELSKMKLAVRLFILAQDYRVKIEFSRFEN